LCEGVCQEYQRRRVNTQVHQPLSWVKDVLIRLFLRITSVCNYRLLNIVIIIINKTGFLLEKLKNMKFLPFFLL